MTFVCFGSWLYGTNKGMNMGFYIYDGFIDDISACF